MSDSSAAYQIHPRRFFGASRTFTAWNKITAYDVHHALRTEAGFEGQNIYFILNHPIQYVRLVGLVVEVESFAQGKYTLLTLDDGSGECINVKVTRRKVAEDDVKVYPSNTEVDEVNVHFEMGLPAVAVLGAPVNVGTVLKVKCSITAFRNVRQLDLKKASIVRTTNEEAASWFETAAWKSEKLSQPWVLSAGERIRLDEENRETERREAEERLRDKARCKQKQARSEEHKQWKLALHDERQVKRAAKQKKQEAFFDAGALEGSGVLRGPWDDVFSR